MNTTTFRLGPAAALAVLLLPFSIAAASAQSPQVLAEDATRYLALGDSIAAGYKVAPVTQAYPYLLYQDGAFDRMPHTLFANASVPGAASGDVLLHQVPQAIIPAATGGFSPQYITLTVGGNDLLSVLRFAATHPDPNEVIQFAQGVLAQYAQNLGAILFQLQSGLPGVKIFVANQYTIPEIQAVLPFTDTIIDAFNAVVENVIEQSGPNVFLVDVHRAFLDRNSLLWIDRPAAGPFEVHVTSVGQRVMAKAFADVIARHR
jgi:lysophospholipase L1-like esterase